jgi:uncharacterized protein YhaN
MRIRRLTLDRFGHFTDGVLDFTGGGDFHLMCGPNEAGKTTTLNALGDLFFGIGQRSAYNFKHANPDMRLGAEIVAADGRTLEFRRRKGRQNTLLDPDNNTLPEAALTAFLGPIDRDFFEGMFGLDHARLRKGGEDILAARGEVGQSLFGAGAGIVGLSQILGELDDEANRLFTARKHASKPFYVALDRYNDARKRLREAAVSGDDWRQLRAEIEAAEAQLDTTRADLHRLEAARARAERIRRILPMMTERAAVEQRLAELADAVPLPEDAAARQRDAVERRDRAQREVERCTALAERLTAQLAETAVPEALLARAAELEALYEQRAVIRDQRADLPKREGELRQMRDQAADLLRRLGSPLPVDRAAEAIPPRAVQAEIRALIAEEGKRRTRADGAAEQLAKAGAELARLESLLMSAGLPADPAPLQAALAEVKARGALEKALADATDSARRLQHRVSQAISALPMWQGSIEELIRAKVPDEATVRRFEDEDRDLTARTQRAREKAEGLAADVEAIEREIAQLERAGDKPPAAAVAAPRRRRDTGWRVIRQVFIEGNAEPLAPEEARMFDASHDLPGAYEQAVRQADALADRKEAEAQRVARYGELARRRNDLARKLASARGEAAGCASQRAQLDTAWQSAWRAAGLSPASPREMAAWLARADAIARDVEAVRDVETQCRRLQEDCDQSMTQLSAALAELGVLPAAGATLAVLSRQAEALVQRLAEAAADRRSLERRLIEQRVQVEETRRQTAAAAGEIENWRCLWQQAVARLGGPSDATPAGIEEMLTAIEDLDRCLAAIPDKVHRIARMGENVGRFERNLAELVAALAPELAGSDPIDAASVLFGRLQDARQAADRRAELAARLDEARGEVADFGRARAEAEAALAGLRREAQCDGDDALALAVERATARRDAQRRCAELERQILAAGDGLTLEQMAAEAERCDPDELAAELRQIAQDLADLHHRGTELGGELQRLNQRHAEMERGRGAGAAAQEAQDALADLRATAESYIRVRTAAVLLRRAIDRYRQEQQGPLLHRAGALFHRLTLGGFSGFKVDYDERDQPILKGERSSGALVDVAGMSDGTRDQLFLSLRIAAIEHYVASSEPIPFVADDLLINYDDDRAGAALEVLHDLSRRTQVLFFTHHPHLCEVARHRLGGNALTVHSLARPAVV